MALASRFASAWLNDTEDGSGLNPNLEEERLSSSLSPSMPRLSSPQRFNLLVAEDNLPDALLVREAIRTENLPLDVHVAADGAAAIDFLARAEAEADAPCPHLLV